MEPISIKFKNRGCFTRALVLEDEVLLGGTDGGYGSAGLPCQAGADSQSGKPEY